MKLAIILIALCAVLFVVVLATPNRAPAPSGSGTDVKPPAWASLLADLPFGPSLDLKISAVTLPPGGTRSFAVPAASSKARIGRFSLTQGQAAVIAYDCGNESLKGCQQTQCLVAGATMALPPGCNASDFNARGAPTKARISVLGSGGTIVLRAPAGAATVGID